MDRISFKEAPAKAIVYILVATLIGVGIGVAVGISTKAEGATNNKSEPETSFKAVQCATTDSGSCGSVTKRAKRFKRRYHNDRLGDGNGFNHRRVFAQPKKARRLIVRRLTRVIRAARAAGPDSARSGSARLQARAKYAGLQKDSGQACEFQQLAKHYYKGFNPETGKPSIPGRCFENNYRAPRKIGTKTLAQGLGLTACGAGVVVTILTPAGRAASAALKFWGASSQMLGCTSMAMLIGLED